MCDTRSSLWSFLLAAASCFTANGQSGDSSLNRPQRNHNPLNIKYGGATKQWVELRVAEIDPKAATDGGHFLKFQNYKIGYQAGRELLRSPVYRDLNVDAAMRKWSGSGYGAEIAPELRGKTIGQLSDSEINGLMEKMAHREGFYANGYRPPLPTPEEQAQIEKISADLVKLFQGGTDAQPARRTVKPLTFGDLVRQQGSREAGPRNGEPSPPGGEDELPPGQTPPPAATAPAGWTGEAWQDSSTRSYGTLFQPPGAPGGTSYIQFQRHGGFPRTPYTPSGILSEIVRSSWGKGRSVTQRSVVVGKGRMPGSWASTGDAQGVAFAHRGNVYLVSAVGVSDAVFWEFIENIEVAAAQPTDSVRFPEAGPRQAPSTGPTGRFVPPDPLPEPGYYSEYLGLNWDGGEGRECVWAARQFAERYHGRTIPSLGKTGGAEKVFRISTPGFRKVPNDGASLPPPGALLVWDRSVNRGTGHVAVNLDTTDRATRTVRVIDSNWGKDFRGQVHDVRIGSSIQGWLVPE